MLENLPAGFEPQGLSSEEGTGSLPESLFYKGKRNLESLDDHSEQSFFLLLWYNAP